VGSVAHTWMLPVLPMLNSGCCHNHCGNSGSCAPLWTPKRRLGNRVSSCSKRRRPSENTHSMPCFAAPLHPPPPASRAPPVLAAEAGRRTFARSSTKKAAICDGSAPWMRALSAWLDSCSVRFSRASSFSITCTPRQRSLGSQLGRTCVLEG
jgi:hypothetical protein